MLILDADLIQSSAATAAVVLTRRPPAHSLELNGFAWGRKISVERSVEVAAAQLLGATCSSSGQLSSSEAMRVE